MEVLQADNVSGVEDSYSERQHEIERLQDTAIRYMTINPSHYTDHGKEAHDVISDVLKLAEIPPVECFDAGNFMKYVRRAGHKGDDGTYKEDVYKAANYLHRLVFGEWLQ